MALPPFLLQPLVNMFPAQAQARGDLLVVLLSQAGVVHEDQYIHTKTKGGCGNVNNKQIIYSRKIRIPEK
jgi:hypothetical protein